MSTTTTRSGPPPAPATSSTSGSARQAGQGTVRKIFPDHWSFMLGEVALYSFIILLLTGTFLTFFYVPSVGHTAYDGSYAPLVGQTMSEAYASTVATLVRRPRWPADAADPPLGGADLRRGDHVHMFRVFFTGAFRKPREINWVIGVILALLADRRGLRRLLAAGRPAVRHRPADQPAHHPGRSRWSAVYLSFFVFGGEFPGEAFIPRLYTIHVLLLPGDLPGADHRAPCSWSCCTSTPSTPGPGRTNDNVVGYPLFPVYMAKAGGFFFIVFGVIALMSALFTINPIWAYGPYDPSPVTAGSQPDWYMGLLDGAVRLTPGFLEFTSSASRCRRQHHHPGADHAWAS